ncbi:ATP-binding protein [Emticicia sp. TH156]|uniref:ATP-binding protein n=1 Tax=Emticicia sp. TH156 TaxID=2067454 RepID=UPI000C78112F|nr:ATP-binding protein [Emticicia sp. TH156]PLK45950.1 hypothetical protein C0V77_00940 [Emticicia sp. TH156]
MDESVLTAIDSFKKFNFFSINDKEFSDLVYCIFRNESASKLGDYYGKYNRVTPSPETREKGKDSMLYFNDKLVGVIQCKLIKKNTNLNDFLNEFIKFILYGIDDNLFIEAREFYYYFVAPYGFNNEVLDFTRSDNRQIPNLNKVINKVLSNYSTLKTAFGNTSILELEKQITDIIQKVVIEPLNSIQLNSWLNKDYNKHLITNNPKYSEYTDEPIEQILNDFSIASGYVANCSNSIDGIPDSHILRDEVNQLYDKINAPNQNDRKNHNVYILVGEAGCGKSGIMKDLYDRLYQSEVPVLGIKSDKYENLSSLNSLQDQLNLQDSIFKQINTLSFRYEKVVLLIDQIDAITLFQSTKNNNWNTYRTLISALEKKENVRIVISIRKVDLETDIELKELNQYNKITVGPLTEADVTPLLKQKGIKYDELPKSLRLLLAIPNNLNIFSKINNAKIDVNKLTTLNSLYKELWRQKITNCPKLFKISNNRCSELTFGICAELSSQGSLLTSDEIFIDDYYEELKYLKSCGILREHTDEIEFFHSKFFEYALAKSFIAKKKTLLEYIIENRQFLEIRPIIRTVLDLQKDTNKLEYYQSCTSILTSDEVKFHFKLLVINSLAFQTSITQNEKLIVEKNVFSNPLLKTYFLETVIGLEWLKFLTEKNIYSHLIEAGEQNLCSWLLRRNLPDERNFILDILKNNIVEFGNKRDFIVNILSDLKIWDNDLAYQLYDENAKHEETQIYQFCYMMEDVSSFKPEWVIKKFNATLEGSVNKTSQESDILSNFKHEQRQLLKVLFDRAPQQSFEFILCLIEKLISLRMYDCNYTALKRDFAFGIWRDNDKGNRSLIGMFSDFVKKQAECNSLIFRNFIRTHSQNNSITILELLINGFLSNPKIYKDEVYNFVLFFNEKKGFTIDEKIHYKIRRLITILYLDFNNSQKERINEIILSIQLAYEKDIFIREGVRKHYLHLSGKTKYKYINIIPIDEINKNTHLKKLQQELNRKFGENKDEKPENPIAKFITAPLPSNAYNKMSIKDWEKTFLIYHDDYQRAPFSFKGSLLEHSRAFKEQVKERSDFFFPLIEDIINKFLISRHYVIEGFNGLIEANHNPNEVKRIFKLAMWSFKDRNTILYATWIIRYFIKNDIVDKEIIDFLSYHAKTHFDPKQNENSTDKLMSGINSVRGSIAEKLNYCYKSVEHQNLIFTTVEVLANDKTDAVRVAVVHQLHQLIYLNSGKTLSIFQSIIKNNTKNEAVLKASISTANKFSFQYYDDIEFYFRLALNYEDLQGDISQCLFYCWLDDNEKALPLLESTLEKYHKCKIKIIYCALECLVENDTENLDTKAFNILLRYINENDKEIADEYNRGILRLKPEYFMTVLPFLKEYSRSNVIKIKHGYFYHYLLSCCDKFPIECLDLIKNFDKFSPNDDHYDNDLLQIILTCYYRFGEDEISNKLEAIELFDKTLMDNRYRLNAFKTIDLFD